MASSDGHYYVDSKGRILARGYGQVGTVPGWGDLTGEWAQDGDYICALVDNSGAYTMQITDWQGHSRGFAVSDIGPQANLLACSTSTNRAVVLEQVGTQHEVITVRSLSDGHLERTINAPAQWWPVSANVQWLAVISGFEAPGPYETTIISLADGTVHARFPGEGAHAFFPDGVHLLLSDQAGTRTRVIDWRTGAEIWSRPGFAAEIAASDPVTDKLLVDFVTGSVEAGTDKHDYWILDGTGAVIRFIPIVEAPPASAAR
jgi:hypothetical protein